MWSFDLIETQIMQLHVPEAERGVVNSVEYSLTNVFALMSYALGIIARYVKCLQISDKISLCTENKIFFS